MKKIGVTILIVLVSIVAIFLIAPKFYDFDPVLRPILEEKFQNLSGKKITLGKIRLDAWGGFGVSIEKIEFTSQGISPIVLEANGASFKLNYISVLRGVFRLHMEFLNASLSVDRSHFNQGKVKELLSFLGSNHQQRKAEGKSRGLLQGLLDYVWQRLEMSFELKNSKLFLRDQGQVNDIQISSLHLENFGFDKKAKVQVKLKGDDFFQENDFKLGQEIEVNGFLQVVGGEPQLNADLVVDMDKASLEYKNLIKKSPGEPLSLELNFGYSADKLSIEQANIVVENQRLRLSGNISVFKEPVEANLKIVSSYLDLQKWHKIVPSLSFYNLVGLVNLSADINIKNRLAKYEGNLRVSQGGALLPGIVNPFTAVRSDIDFTEHSIEVKELGFAIGKSTANLNFVAKGKNLNQIQGAASFGSLDIDDLFLDLPEESKLRRIRDMQESQQELTDENRRFLLQSLFEILGSKPWFKELNANIDLNIKQVFWKQAFIENVSGQATIIDGQVKITKGLAEYQAGKLGFVLLIYRGRDSYYQDVKAKFLSVNLNSVLSTIEWLPKDFVTGQATGEVDLKIAKEEITASGSLKLGEGSFLLLQSFAEFDEMLYRLTRVSDQGESIGIGRDFFSAKTNFRYKEGELSVGGIHIQTKPSDVQLIGDISFRRPDYLSGKLNAIFQIQNIPDRIKYSRGFARIGLPLTGTLSKPRVPWEQIESQLYPAFHRKVQPNKSKVSTKATKTKILKDKNAKEYLNKLEP